MSAMSGFRKFNDQRIADEVNEDRSLMCCVNGCPNRWSADFGSGRFCGAHFMTDPRDWPVITQEQLHHISQLAFERQRPKPPAPVVSREERIEILQRLRNCVGKVDPKAWAYQLREREEAGEKLTQAQREMWRAALRFEPKGETE